MTSSEVTNNGAKIAAVGSGAVAGVCLYKLSRLEGSGVPMSCFVGLLAGALVGIFVHSQCKNKSR